MTRRLQALAYRGILCAGFIVLAFVPAQARSVERIEIRIQGVEAPVEENIRAFLTLGRYTEREDLTDDQVRRLSFRAVDEAADAMRPFGYYEPSIRSRTTRDEGNWIVRLKIDPGRPVIMNNVIVELKGAGASDPALAQVADRTPLKPGARLNHSSYERLKLDLLRAARDNGYLDATIAQKSLVVNPADFSADARIVFETGGQYRFGQLEIDQDVINPELLQGFVRFTEGENYSARAIRNTQFALEDSNYFSNVSVSSGDRDPDTLTVPLKIMGEPIKRSRYTVSGGYATDTGIRGRFVWHNRRVNRSGHRWLVETTLSQIKQNAIARYIIPIGDPSLEKLEFSGGYVNEKLGDLDSERFELIGSITQVKKKWQRVLFLQVNDEVTTNPDGTESNVLLLIPGISFASLPPHFLTGWVREAAYFAQLSGSPQTLGSDESFLRFYGSAERVWPLGGPWHLRVRGELGTTWVNDFSELPASQRFFTGGDRTVRGFGLNELSPPPEDPNDVKELGKSVGGEHLLVGSLELERDIRESWRATVFFDTGNAFNSWGDPLEYSVGIGVRWRLPMMMIGVDLAQALSEPGKNPRIHLNVTQVL
jgi:translocation and assembly module TamA